MKRLFALLTVLALLCCMLTACSSSPQDLIKKADAVLLESPYTVTMKMEFDCDNADMNKVLSAMNMEIPVTVDGKNIAMDLNMELMGQAVKAKVTVADMVMYYDMSVMGQSIKMKAAMNDEQYQKFLEENNTEMMVNPEDFGKLSMETKDGKKVITCAEIGEDALKELNKTMEDALEATGGKATVGQISYTVTLKDGKYESMDMACTYSVTVGSQSYNVSFKLGAKYTYGSTAKITAPADADKYQDVPFSDLMG